MGAGKSTVGIKLAGRMNYRFIDIDSFIEEKEQMSIPDIFQKKGEAYFRQLEHDTILEISELNENLIVSTGGGAPCFMDNMALLKSTGLTIYLKLDPQIIFHRLTHAQKKNRPLIENKSPEELKQFIMDKLNEREPVYNLSHIILPGENLNFQKLEKRIKSYFANPPALS